MSCALDAKSASESRDQPREADHHGDREAVSARRTQAASHPCSCQMNGMAVIVTSAISRFIGTPMRRKIRETIAPGAVNHQVALVAIGVAKLADAAIITAIT